jgi:hypothetical protein
MCTTGSTIVSFKREQFMTHQKHQLLTSLIGFILILVGCNSIEIKSYSIESHSKPTQPLEFATEYIQTSNSQNSQQTEKNVDECIPPLETFAYSLSTDSSKPQYPGNGPIILPPSPWQAEEALSQNLSIITTRIVQGHREIWFKKNPYNPSGSKFREFIIYYPESKEWKSISSKVGSDGGYVGKLFVAKNGSLWGQIFWDTSQNSTEQHTITGQPVLSSYNEETKQFEFENETKQFSNTSMEPNETIYDPKILLDPRGIFWIFVQKDAVYSYDPVTKETRHHVDISKHVVSDPELAPDGSIYYVNNYYLTHGMTLTMQDKEIFHFMPETDTIEKIYIPLQPWPLFSSILVDDTGKLWLDSIGWKEPDGNWYQVHQSPIFITNVLWSGVEYRWKTPRILMESSDNRLWFSSDNGLAWLDAKKGKWCWFTTEQSNIVEDQEHNLWMIADNTLYKYPLTP